MKFTSDVVLAVFYKLLTETGEDGVDMKISIKMSDFDLHLKRMIEKVLKPAGLIFRYSGYSGLHGR